MVGIDFYLERRENKVTFKEKYREVAEKQLELMNYGHGDNFGKAYSDGNRAFANGEAYMYIQGTWAISKFAKRTQMWISVSSRSRQAMIRARSSW